MLSDGKDIAHALSRTKPGLKQSSQHRESEAKRGVFIGGTKHRGRLRSRSIHGADLDILERYNAP